MTLRSRRRIPGAALVGSDPCQCLLQINSRTYLLHQPFSCRRAFGCACRLGRVEPLLYFSRGFTPALVSEGQLLLGFLPLGAHEICGLQATPFNPIAGDRSGLWQGESSGLWAGSFPLPTMPSAGSCAALRPPRGSPSPKRDTAQAYRGKLDRLLRTTAGFTSRALDGYGLRDLMPARPALPASYPVLVHRLVAALHASSPRSVTPRAVALRFVRCGQLTGGLPPPGSRPCWAHQKKRGGPKPASRSRPEVSRIRT